MKRATTSLGAIVYVARNTGAVFSRWLVIDGRQRLTTLTLLLIALRDHILSIPEECNGK